jgi:very-short-patch-repair endonuclease
MSSVSTVELANLLASLSDLPIGAIQAVQTDDSSIIADLVRANSGVAGHRRFLYLPLGNTGTLHEAIECVADKLNALVEASWPYWFGDIDFGWFRDDALGNERLREFVRDVCLQNNRISPHWVTAAVRVAGSGRSLRRMSVDSTIQAAQLSLTLSPPGMILFLPFDETYEPEPAAVAVALVEWTARHTESVVVPIIPAGWPSAYPVDRLLCNAWRIEDRHEPGIFAESGGAGSKPGPVESSARRVAEISVIVGQPHPLSDVEKRVWAHLSRDAELGSLFRCNQTVTTRRGSRPRVDLLWSEGAVVVELDGYPDHSGRDAFERDRHRDYELLMSGYHVLRLTNDEVNRDLEAAVGKIRDVVDWRMLMKNTEKRS